MQGSNGSCAFNFTLREMNFPFIYKFPRFMGFFDGNSRLVKINTYKAPNQLPFCGLGTVPRRAVALHGTTLQLQTRQRERDPQEEKSQILP